MTRARWCAALALVAACGEPTRAVVRGDAAADAPPDVAAGRAGPPGAGDCAAQNGGCSAYARCEPAGAGARRCVCAPGLRVKPDGLGCEGLLLVSAAPDGRAGRGASIGPAVALTGRYVAFESTATDLPTEAPLPAVNPPVSHCYLRDVVAGRTVWISARSDGGVATEGFGCRAAQVTDDGRRVAFVSWGTLTLDDPPAQALANVYVRPVTEALEVGPPQRLHLELRYPLTDHASHARMSRDGRRFAVATRSRLTGAGPPETDVFLYTEDPPTVTAVSVDAGGAFPSYDPRCGGNNDLAEFSGDGSFVAFHGARRYVREDDDAVRDPYVRGLTTGQTELLAVRRTSAPPRAGCSYRGAGGISLSRTGRYALFFSDNPRLDETLEPGRWDFFVRDRTFPPSNPRGVRRLHAQPVVPPSGPDMGDATSLSDDGDLAALVSYRRLDQPDAPEGGTDAHLYLLDLSDPELERAPAAIVDVDARGRPSATSVFYPDLAGDGSAVAFVSGSPLVPEDTNTHPDVYLRVLR